MVVSRIRHLLLTVVALALSPACSVDQPEPATTTGAGPGATEGAEDHGSTDPAATVRAAIEATRNDDAGSHQVRFEDWDGVGRRVTTASSAWAENGWTIVYEVVSPREPAVGPTEIRSVDGVRYGRLGHSPWVADDLLRMAAVSTTDPLSLLDILELAVRYEAVRSTGDGWYETSWQMGLLNRLLATDAPTTARVRVVGGGVVELEAALPDGVAVLHASWDPAPPEPIVAPS